MSERLPVVPEHLPQRPSLVVEVHLETLVCKRPYACDRHRQHLDTHQRVLTSFFCYLYRRQQDLFGDLLVRLEAPRDLFLKDVQRQVLPKREKERYLDDQKLQQRPVRLQRLLQRVVKENQVVEREGLADDDHQIERRGGLLLE